MIVTIFLPIAKNIFLDPYPIQITDSLMAAVWLSNHERTLDSRRHEARLSPSSDGRFTSVQRSYCSSSPSSYWGFLNRCSSYLAWSICFRQQIFAEKPQNKTLYIVVSSIAWIPITVHIFARLYPFFFNLKVFRFSRCIG